MNDPHVEKLFYRVIISDNIDYDNAPPISGETNDFTWHLSREQLILQYKTHFATEREAITVAESFLEAWEVSIGLRQSPHDLTFKFQNSSIVDRSPTPREGTQTLEVKCSECLVVSDQVDAKQSYTQFPAPCHNFKVSPDVEKMYLRYSSYRKDKDRLLAMAYFCLTIVECSTEVSNKKRPAAAAKYGIDIDVLDKLGELSSKAGDKNEARKYSTERALAPLTRNQKTWVESVVKKLIERLAEYAYDHSAKLPMITMNDFPSIPQKGEESP